MGVKVNLIYGDEGYPLDNYLNINPFGTTSETIRVGGVQNLDEFVDNGEADEIIAENVVEYIPSPNLAATLSNWVSKLRVGGKLILTFTDAKLVSKEFSNYRTTLEEFNSSIHGSQEKPYLIKRCSVTTLDLCKHLTENHNVKVVKRRINNSKGSIVVERVK